MTWEDRNYLNSYCTAYGPKPVERPKKGWKRRAAGVTECRAYLLILARKAPAPALVSVHIEVRSHL